MIRLEDAHLFDHNSAETLDFLASALRLGHITGGYAAPDLAGLPLKFAYGELPIFPGSYMKS